MSKCYICKVEQTEGNTPLTTHRASGFKSRCRKCDKKYMKKYHRERYKEDPRFREKVKLRTYKWRKDNPEKNAAIDKRNHGSYKIIMHEIKVNGCAICGYDKCDSALDFHHVNSKAKKFNCGLHNLMRRSKNYIKEVNKCILLCRNCHSEIHELERSSKT